MKKLLLAAAALFCSLAAYAQTPSTTPRRLAKIEAGTRQPEADKVLERNDHEEAVAPANHGQTVRTVAQATPLSGADKGAAVSAVASGGRATRTARSPRADRGRSAYPANNSRATTHFGGRGRHGGN